MSYPVVESFFSLSGEAPWAGRPLFLIRFAGCNLSCSYCDTPYHHQAAEHWSEDELRARIQSAARGYPGIFVLFSGGEPLLGERRDSLAALARSLPDVDFSVETNGSILLPDSPPANLGFVLDWKSGSSGHGDSFDSANIGRLRPGIDCVKFVVNREDLPELAERVARLSRERPGVRLWASPQWGGIELAELASFIIERRLDLGLSVQLHKLIWGERRGV